MKTRRQFLKSAASLAALSPFAPMASLGAEQATVKKGKTLVVVFLRGGIDGLNFIVPHGDKDYYKHRERIAIARPGGAKGAVDLDGFFGLHPAADALKPLFDSGTCRGLQAVGYAENSRSHFEEQDTWETGVMGDTVSADGWLNRHLNSSKGRGTIRAVSIGGNLPRILRGKAAAYSIRSVGDLAMPKLGGDQELIQAALRDAYCQTPGSNQEEARELMSKTAAATLEGAKQLEAVAKTKYEPKNGAKYAENGIGNTFKEAARLIRADIGTEVIEIDYGGWDTHNNQGGADGGYANRLRDLTKAMAAFAKDLDGKMEDVMVLTLSDFGRTVRENGTSGTDHGWANCMVAMGGAAIGKSGSKPIHGEWPGLAPEQLYQNRDLKHTTDFRNVIGDAVSRHLGNPSVGLVLPNHQYQSTGLMG